MTKFNMPVTDIIRQRYSCRTYISKPIEQDIRLSLAKFASVLEEESNGIQARFELIAVNEEDSRALASLGTYGFIHRASGFLIGATSDGNTNLEQFGYLMEKWVLKATDLGLGTCWLGGTFTKSSFARKISASEDEIIPAVIATGYPDKHTRVIERVIHRGSAADRRYPWETLFFHQSLGKPLSHEKAGDYSVPLEMVRLAPSASNKQPWRIIKDGRAFHFYLKRTPGYREGMINRFITQADLQRIDMGIAMCHFELTARELGIHGMWTRLDPEINQPDDLTEYTVSWMED